MPLFRKMRTLPKADRYICLKFYYIFAIISTTFRQHFPLLACGTLYRSLTFIWTTKNEQNWLYAIDQKQKKNGNNAQIQFLDRQSNFFLPLWEPVLPLGAILRAKSR